jgi:hypothetical protein
MNEFEDYEILFQTYFNKFNEEHGSRKTDKIIQTIGGSKYTSDLFKQSIEGNFTPTIKDFETFVFSSNFTFTFASREKVAFASIVMLNLWHDTVNLKMNLATELTLISLFNGMIRKAL